jgi:hypothetical protein
MTRRGQVIPFPRPHAARTDADGLVEIHRCDRPEAMVVKGLLESEGIPLLLRSRVAHSVHPFTVGAQGEVVLLVPSSAATRAARLLTRMVPAPPPG